MAVYNRDAAIEKTQDATGRVCTVKKHYSQPSVRVSRAHRVIAGGTGPLWEEDAPSGDMKH